VVANILLKNLKGNLEQCQGKFGTENHFSMVIL